MKTLKNILRYEKYFVLIGVFIFLYVLIVINIPHNSLYKGTESKIEGTVKDIKLNGNKLTLLIKGKEKVIANYYFKNKEEKENIFEIIHLGDKVILEGILNEPLENTIPNTFNYKKYLKYKKIYYTFSINNYEVSNHNILYKGKDYLLKKIYERENSDYLLSFIMGDKTLLTSDIYNDYQTNGISHLLALSGMHINTLVVVLSLLLKKTKHKDFYVGAFLCFYLFIASFSASLIRSVLFYLLKLVNKKFNLRFSNLHLLFICAYLILLFNPFMIFDTGFIYSFVIVFGIFYYHNFIKGNYLLKSLKLSLVTFIFSLPITALLNYEVNLTSLVLNLFFIPWVSLIIYPCILLTLFIPFLDSLLSLLINITNYLNEICTYLKIIINIPKMPCLMVIIYYYILLRKFKCTYLYLSFIILFTKFIYILDTNYYVYYFDVDQGDSSVLVSPYKKEVIMIDTGGKVTYKMDEWKMSTKTYNLSDNVIKFLKSVGITKLDYLIISHGDQDHAGEALNIIDKLKIERIVLNEGNFNNLENKILRKRVNLVSEYKLTYFKVSNLNKRVYDNENDNSIVNYITFEDIKLLFMGDASIEVEKNILESYNEGEVDVLKVGHHGSKTSSSKAFISKIKPKYSIISVGKNNSYGHPHKEVLEVLNSSYILKTDTSGTITFKFGMKHKGVKTMVKV